MADLDTPPDPNHNHLVRGIVIVLTAVMLTACSFVSQQVAISSASDCIHRQCSDPDARDYTSCEAACRAQAQYQR